MTKIDRRISKTKKAIYQAFLQLLNAKGYEATTVQAIIDLADVGRSTFYCHYESKELLLDQLCRYLFHHLFEREQSISTEDYLPTSFCIFRKIKTISPVFYSPKMTTSSVNSRESWSTTSIPCWLMI